MGAWACARWVPMSTANEPKIGAVVRRKAMCRRAYQNSRKLHPEFLFTRSLVIKCLVMRIRQVVTGALLAMFLSGCVHPGSQGNGLVTTPATPKPNEPKTVTDTRVYVRNNCVLGYQAVAQQESLIGTFIPVLLDKAYSGIVAAFRKAGEDTVVKKFGTRPFYLYEAGKTAPAALKLSGAFGCMILIDGDFAAKTP